MTVDISNEMFQDGTMQPEKVHVRGLDNLATADIKNFAREHFPMDDFVKVEWIDDTSANVVYESAEAARQALQAFTAPIDTDPTSLPPLQLRPAKSFSTHPMAELQVRQALSTDVKKARAHEASRYYLMHPEQDPREHRNKPRRPRRYSDEKGDYRRRRFDEREHKRRRDGDGAARFDASMYDDDVGEAMRGAHSASDRDDDADERLHKRVRFNRRGGDLFGPRAGMSSGGRLRDRSASPERGGGDGRLGFSEDETSVRRRIRQRSLTPPARRPREAQGNSGKELFSKTPRGATTSFLSSQPAAGAKELFPNKVVSTPTVAPAVVAASPTTPRELFPNKTAISNHRRTAAVDTGIKSPDLFPNGPSAAAGRTLADRISADVRRRPGSFGEEAAPPPTGGFSVRGASKAAEAPGFSIRGASLTGDGAAAAPPARELFPLKSGSNAGKELFGEKIKGRGAARRRAEDMYF